MAKRASAIKSTERAVNVEVTLVGDPTLEQMEAMLESEALRLGLHFSKITKLGAKRYPGNRHWHVKEHPKERGCLDVTYWPGGALMWVTMRNYEPPWVHKKGTLLRAKLEARIQADFG